MSEWRPPKLLGIVNVTRDSFSDGGRFLVPDTAVTHAKQLLEEGADVIDLGAESSHPDAEDVPAEVEIARLGPVVRILISRGATISIDTWKPAVIRAMLELGVQWINDITALRDPESVAVLRDSSARVILMHSIAQQARAGRDAPPPRDIVPRILQFFEGRLAALESAGIARSRILLDPGMGLFLSTDPAASLAVLNALPTLRGLGCPLCICPSRKSFIGTLLGSPATPLPVDDRSPGTLACELWAANHGVEYIRTHDVRALNAPFRSGVN